MGRILTLVLGMAVLGFIAYQVVYHRGKVAEGSSEVQAPTQALENARKAASRIEAEQAKHADEALEKADPKE